MILKCFVIKVWSAGFKGRDEIVNEFDSNLHFSDVCKTWISIDIGDASIIFWYFNFK